MSRYRFIEAERACHPVAVLARVLKVSRVAYYSSTEGRTSARTQADEALLGRIRAIHQESRGTTAHPVSRPGFGRRAPPAPASGWPPDARERPGRALPPGASERPRSPTRWLGRWTSSAGTSKRPRWTASGWRTSPMSAPGRASPTSPWSSTLVLGGWWAGPWPTTCAPSSPPKRFAWPSAAAVLRPPSCITPIGGCQYTSDAYGQLLAAHGAFQSVGRPGTC